MWSKKLNLLLAASVFFTAAGVDAKVYQDVRIKKYKASFDIRDYSGKKTFLELMKDQIYKAIEKEWTEGNYTDRNHISNVAQGNGVELRLTDDVSTYHVKFKDDGSDKAERSGRSFSAVGSGSRIKYVADASYLHYLRQLNDLSKDRDELQGFYTAILKVIADCDSSGFEDLSTKAKRVGADFIAVYVAEQYRHLLSGRGKKLGRSHNWDDALFQVTLLAAFHAGQSDGESAMYYESQFAANVWDQFICVYRQGRTKWREREDNKRRPFNLTDYWQFGKTCSRSGVNVTRRDFQKMGYNITEWMDENRDDFVGNVAEALGSWGSNLVQEISGFFISNRAYPKIRNVDYVVGSILDYLKQSRYDANRISKKLPTFRGRASDSEIAQGNEDKYFDAVVSEDEAKLNKAMLEDEELDDDLK